MKRLAILFALSVIAFAPPLEAQSGRNGFAGFSFVSPLRLSVGRDRNFLINKSTPNEALFYRSFPASVQPFLPEFGPQQVTDDMFLLALPTTGYVNDGRRHRLAATYQPEYEFLRRNSDLNTWSHDVRAEFSYSLSRRLELSVSDSFQASNDPSRSTQNLLLVLPRDDFRYNTLRAGVEYAYSPITSFAVKYDNTATIYGKTDPFQTRILDSMGSGVTVSGERVLRQNNRVRVSYSMFSVKEINGATEGDDNVDRQRLDSARPAHGLSVDYRFVFNRQTVFDFTGGVVNTATDTNYLYGAGIGRRVGGVWIDVGYKRTIAFYGAPQSGFANGISSTSYFDLVQFGVRGQPLSRLGVELSGLASRATSGAGITPADSIVARGRVDYRLSPRLVAFLQMETYQQNSNIYVPSPLSRNRLFTGIEFSLSPESDRRTSRLNRDAQYVALTDRSRRDLDR